MQDMGTSVNIGYVSITFSYKTSTLPWPLLASDQVPAPRRHPSAACSGPLVITSCFSNATVDRSSHMPG